MNQEEITKQDVVEESEKTFLSKVSEFFIKLLEKFSKGRYSTPEEQAFFADEKNLYDENGRLTEAYQKKIKEYEEYVKKQDTDQFLHEIHSQNSEEFGTAYNETEMAILDNASAFISDQEKIVRDLEQSKDATEHNDTPFDLDAWLAGYLKKQGICDDINFAYEKIRDIILDELEMVDKDIKDIEKDDVYQITKRIDIREIYQKTIDEVLKGKEV